MKQLNLFLWINRMFLLSFRRYLLLWLFFILYRAIFVFRHCWKCVFWLAWLVWFFRQLLSRFLRRLCFLF